MLLEMHTALGKPVVPEEHKMATVWSPPSFRGSGLVKEFFISYKIRESLPPLTDKTFQ